jgi:hypothetical protein
MTAHQGAVSQARGGRICAARLLTSSAIDGLTHTVRFDWAALGAWFEEDEQVFVHPRSRRRQVSRPGQASV